MFTTCRDCEDHAELTSTFFGITNTQYYQRVATVCGPACTQDRLPNRPRKRRGKLLLHGRRRHQVDWRSRQRCSSIFDVFPLCQAHPLPRNRFQFYRREALAIKIIKIVFFRLIHKHCARLTCSPHLQVGREMKGEGK